MPAIKREHSSDDSDASPFRLSESTPPRDPSTTPQKGKKPRHTVTPTKTPKSARVKREADGTDDDGTPSPTTTPKRGSAAESGSVFGKARISADVKQTIANEIVSRGLASVDLDALEREVSTLPGRCGSPESDERWRLTRSDGPELEPDQVAAPGQPSKHPPATVQPDQDHDLDRTRVSRQDSVMHVHG